MLVIFQGCCLVFCRLGCTSSLYGSVVFSGEFHLRCDNKRWCFSQPLNELMVLYFLLISSLDWWVTTLLMTHLLVMCWSFAFSVILLYNCSAVSPCWIFCTSCMLPSVLLTKNMTLLLLIFLSWAMLRLPIKPPACGLFYLLAVLWWCLHQYWSVAVLFWWGAWFLWLVCCLWMVILLLVDSVQCSDSLS